MKKIFSLIPLVICTFPSLGNEQTGLGCDTDLNQDLSVTILDLLDVLSGFGSPDGDVNNDQITNVLDLLDVVTDLGKVCHPFFNADVSIQNDMVVVISNGLPLHPTGPFDGSTGCFNPNTPAAQNIIFRIPLNPVPTANPSVNALDTFGRIGICTNGVSFYNPYDGGGIDAPSSICFDEFNAHASPDGNYHYHQYSPYADQFYEGGHSSIFGYAADGFPVYGPWEYDGQLASELTGKMALNECNGHTDPIRGFHYHAVSIDLDSEGFPWILGCFHGEPEESNFQGGGPGGGPGGCTSCATNMIPPAVCNCVHNTPGYEYCCTDWDSSCQSYANSFCNGR